MMWMMPECGHFFHMWCIDAWLKLNGSFHLLRRRRSTSEGGFVSSVVVLMAEEGGE
ncbi:RING-H2 finger protein ATL68 [Linum perenne]